MNTKTTNEPPPRFTIPLAEYVAVAGITSALFLLLFPAVNEARDRQNRPPILPWLAGYIDQLSVMFLISIPVVVCVVTWLIVFLFRVMLPLRWKAHFPWFKPRRTEIEPSTPIRVIDDSRPAFITLAVALVGSALLLIGFFHIRSDRTHRRPVITWEGPLADYVGVMFGTGWVLSGIALLLGLWAMSHFCSRYNALAVIGGLLGSANLIFSCLISIGLYED